MNQKNENFLIHCLKLTDIFGVEPKLLYNNSSKHTTVLGGILSILVGITFALGFYAFGKEIFLKELPTTIFSNEYRTSPERFNLTQDKFNFFIGVQNTNVEYYIDPSIINVKVALEKYTKVKSANGDVSFKFDSVKFDTEPCDLERHFGNLGYLFKDQPLNKLLCVDPKAYKQMFIEGTFGQDTYNYIQVQLSACENSTIPGSPICKSEENIKKALGGGFFVLNLIDTIYNPKNYSSVNEYILRDYFTTMSSNYFKEFTFFYRNVDYVTDRGFLIEDEVTDKFLSLENSRELIDLRISPKIFLVANIRLSNFKDKHLRRYVKIQEVVAQIGGLIKGIILFIHILFSAYAKTEYYLELANSLYFFSPESSNNKIFDQEITRKNIFDSNKSCIRMLHSKTLEPNITTNNFVEPQENKFTKVGKILNENKNLKISSSFVKTLKIIMPINTKSQNVMFARNVIKSIKSNNNIKNLLRLFDDFSQFKNFLLNEDQKKLFDLNSKILVYDEAERNETTLYKQDIDFLKEIYDLQVNDMISKNIKNELLKKVDIIIQ
jgi:hypothetical protein